MSRLKTIVSGLGFAEAPRWREGYLWYVDFFSSSIRRTTLTGKDEMVATIEGTPGGLGFLPDGTPLVISQRDFKILRISKDGETSLYADLSEHCRGGANEMLVDGKGHIWVGHHGFDFFGGAEPEPASLLRIDRNGEVHVAAHEMIFPNGTVMLPDGRTLVVAETFANRLTAFDVADDGTLSNRRVWAELENHTPDGICADSEGAIWLGSPLTATFLRVVEGGEVIDKIPTADGRWAVACTLGGEDLKTLCCVTAATSLEDMPKGKSEAFIETARVEVAGVQE